MSNKYTNVQEEQHQGWKAGPGRKKCLQERKCLSHRHAHKAPLATLFAVVFGLLLPSPAASHPIGGDRPTSSGASPQCWKGGAGREPAFRTHPPPSAGMGSVPGSQKIPHNWRNQKGWGSIRETRGEQPQRLGFPVSPWGLCDQTLQHLHHRCSPRTSGSERTFS